MTPTERAQVQRAKVWQFSPLQFVRDVFHVDPTFQQEEALKQWGMLIRAKVKSAKGSPLTDEEKPYAGKMGMSIQSGHDSGKSCFAAWVALHSLVCFPYSKTRITAPAGPQIESVLWPELHKWIRSGELKEAVEHAGRKCYLTEQGPQEWFIEPRTIQPNSSSEEQAEVLGGLHERYVSIIVDEATGVPDAVFRPLEGGLGGVCNLILMIFNPTQHHGYAMESQQKFRKHWVCQHWNCEDLARMNPSFAPNMARDHARIAEKYGKESNFYRIRVQGLPPLAAPDVLIPWEWVMDAANRELVPVQTDPLVIGVDVAGPGEDKTVIMLGRGPVTFPEVFESSKMDTVEIAWQVEAFLREQLEDEEDRNYKIGVDVNGLGAGVYDHLIRVSELTGLQPVNVAERSAEDDRFHRLRDELWWNVRERFESRSVSIPKHDELIGELTNIRWREENGKIRVESKKELLKRGVKSPNFADAYGIKEYVRRYCTSRIARRHQAPAYAGQAVPWNCV